MARREPPEHWYEPFSRVRKTARGGLAVGQPSGWVVGPSMGSQPHSKLSMNA
jgi:hypothetical protein